MGWFHNCSHEVIILKFVLICYCRIYKMVEVNKFNFIDILSEFEHEISKCSFYSLDCEYTSLPNEFTESSFFDSGEDRYLNLRENVSKSLVVQVGITVFRYYRDMNHYKAKIYNFYVFPSSFGKFNVRFTSSSTTINFLCSNRFDFNKVFYDGVPYMNKTELNKVVKEIQEGTLLNTLESNLSYEDADEVIEICTGIKNWSTNNSIGAVTEIPCKPGDLQYNYVLKEAICKLNKEVWASSDNNKITVQKITKEQRNENEKNENKEEIQRNLIESLTGLSKIFEILSSSKKPLVGHNFLIDLITVYHQFCKDLPGSYKTFKQNVNNMFPNIFDTKLIAFEMLRLKNIDKKAASLLNMYKLYENKPNEFHYPDILVQTKGVYEDVSNQRAHDAGWDSYMTGVIFLKMADELVRSKRKEKYSLNVTSQEIFTAVEEYKNLVSIPRAKISYLRLNGPDPASKRPPILYVSSLGKTCLSTIELDAAFKMFEPLHKKPLSAHEALIAVPNYVCFKKILIAFRNSTEFKVEKYSLFRHHRVFRTCLITGVLLPVAISLWFGVKQR